MELMSSLLFCALVAHLPRAFGHSVPDADVKYRISKGFRQMPMPKKVLLNINGPPLVNTVSDLQSVFTDVSCNKCIDCMERAMKAYISHFHIVKSKPTLDELNEHVLQVRSVQRRERSVDSATAEEIAIKTKKMKLNKRSVKSVTVTKYNVDNDVVALRVKDTNLPENYTQVTTCHIYSVKKSFPCDTEEGESLLNIAKRKGHKKNKKVKDTNKTEVTAAPTTPKSRSQFSTPAYRKRQVDNSQVPDNFMTSIEDMY